MLTTKFVCVTRVHTRPHAYAPRASRWRDPADFIATHSALGKVYHYNVDVTPHGDPLRRGHAAHVRRPLDMYLLRQVRRLPAAPRQTTSASTVRE